MNSNVVPGSRAKQLVTELRRASANGPLFIPRYNEKEIRTVLSETNEHFDKMKEHMGSENLETLAPPVQVACRIHHSIVKRNKRCLIAYLEQRAGSLKKIRWELGPILPDEKKANVSNRESIFFNEYGNLIAEYNQIMEVDLTSDLTPPKDFLVQVRVLKDCGEIMVEGGAVTLSSGTTHSLRRRDVEHLIRQGYLFELQQNESC